MDPTSIINALFGRSAEASPTQGKTYLASPPLNYPTSDDVNFARKYDYSYGQPWAPEFNNQSATVLSGDPNVKPVPMQTMSTSKLAAFPEAGYLKDVYAKAALASEGSALAKLGFDPTKFALDPARDPRTVNKGGFYSPTYDLGYANARVPDTLVHESIHRGIQKLKESPYWKPEFDEFYKNSDLSNEYLVRHLMETKMGDPEAQIDDIAPKAKSQRDMSRFLYNKSSDSDRRNKILKQMEDAAAQFVMKRRPGGPR